MNEEARTFIHKKDCGIDYPLEDESDFITKVACCAFIFSNKDRWKGIITEKPKIRFYKDNMVYLVLQDDITPLDIIDGIQDYEIMEISMETNSSLMAGMLQYSVVFTLDYPGKGENIEFTTVGVFENIERARNQCEDIVQGMNGILEEILCEEPQEVAHK